MPEVIVDGLAAHVNDFLPCHRTRNDTVDVLDIDISPLTAKKECRPRPLHTDT